MNRNQTLDLPTTNQPAIEPKAYYQAACVNCRWSVVKGTNNHVVCICRSKEESVELAKTLNNDYAKDPSHHDEGCTEIITCRNRPIGKSV